MPVQIHTYMHTNATPTLKPVAKSHIHMHTCIHVPQRLRGGSKSACEVCLSPKACDDVGAWRTPFKLRYPGSSLCVCVCICMYVYHIIYVCVYVYIYIYICILYAYVYVGLIFTSTDDRLQAWFVWFLFVCIYVCMYVCM